MIGLPKSTEFNKRIPKQKFYENMEISPVIKQIFVEQIKMIYWRNKIAVSTTNLATGHDVTEIEVFEIRLNHSELDELRKSKRKLDMMKDEFEKMCKDASENLVFGNKLV